MNHLSVRKLGFGTMRLPLTDPGNPRSVDLAQFKQMVDLYLSRGFCYFDTAYPYHGEYSFLFHTSPSASWNCMYRKRCCSRKTNGSILDLYSPECKIPGNPRDCQVSGDVFFCSVYSDASGFVSVSPARSRGSDSADYLYSPCSAASLYQRDKEAVLLWTAGIIPLEFL